MLLKVVVNVLGCFQKFQILNLHQPYLHQTLFRRHLSNRSMSCTVSRGAQNDDCEVLFHEIDESRRISYRKLDGKRSPGVMYIAGFMSNMSGNKAMKLNTFCKQNNYPLLRFDYEGVGDGMSGSFKDIHFGHWKEDALSALDKLTEGPQILVGSSMGFWISILIALERPERIHSLIGISSAFNFTDDYYRSLPKELRDKIDAGEQVQIRIFNDSFIFTKAFFDNSRHFFISTDIPLPIKCPVTLLHAIPDDISPFKNSLLLAKLIQSEKIDVILRKNSDHRMSDDSSITLMLNVLKTHVELNVIS